MMHQMSSCLSTFMRNIRSTSRKNYDSFQLNNATCSWIIALGIRKRLMIRPYRGSRGGTKLFHHIQMITITESHPTSGNLQECNWVHQGNLITPTINNNRGISTMCSHINARSVYPKVLMFQQPGYKILSHPCSDGRRGGGIAIVYKNNLKIKDETPS